MSTGDLGLTGIDLVNGDMEANQAAIDAAIDQVTTQRGELGAFSANTIRVTQNAVQTGIQYTTAAHSVIRDTDYASEISNMVRLEVLQKAALGAMAIAERARGSLLDSLLGR
jgi:flagellin